MWKERSNITSNEAGVHYPCTSQEVCMAVYVYTVNILVLCEVSGGVVVQSKLPRMC